MKAQNLALPTYFMTLSISMRLCLWKLRQEYEIFKRLRGGPLLLQFQAIYEEVGMKQEIDAVIDSLWNIDKEIRHLAYKERETLGLDFKEGDDWRKLLTLIKDNY